MILSFSDLKRHSWQVNIIVKPLNVITLVQAMCKYITRTSVWLHQPWLHLAVFTVQSNIDIESIHIRFFRIIHYVSLMVKFGILLFFLWVRIGQSFLIYFLMRTLTLKLTKDFNWTWNKYIKIIYVFKFFCHIKISLENIFYWNQTYRDWFKQKWCHLKIRKYFG